MDSLFSFKNVFLVHDINIGDLMTVNTSHTINHLSFGQKLANTHNQLDGTSFISEHGEFCAYFLINAKKE